MKKYIIYPGYITSINDNEQHYISAYQLTKLYNIKEYECIIIENKNDKIGIIESDYIQLFPLRNGNYKECLEYLEEEKKKSMCKNCIHKENLKDNKICCDLYDEVYEDDKQIIFCSAKEEVEK